MRNTNMKTLLTDIFNEIFSRESVSTYPTKCVKDILVDLEFLIKYRNSFVKAANMVLQMCHVDPCKNRALKFLSGS